MPAMHVFTLEAVNALVPRLQALMDLQMTRRAEIEQRLERLGELLGRSPQDLELDDTDPPAVRELKTTIVAKMEAYRSAWSEVEEMGAVLKDARMGLIDFYGRVDGRLVCLCWKHGEDAVSHYHGLGEGYAGRKPIPMTMRRRHLH